jgi:hypothetical protein
MESNDNKPQRLVFVRKDEKNRIYLAGTDGQPIRLPGKEFQFITVPDAREPKPEEVAYIQEHINALFLEASMYVSSLTPPSKIS